MNTPVSFKLAKLLKEKGFDNITDLIYMTNHTIEVLFENINGLKHSDGNNPFCSAPTIAEVVMWLHEKYGIWVYVIQTHTNTYQPRMQLKGKGNSNHTKSQIYMTPSEGYLAIIEYIFNDIIN